MFLCLLHEGFVEKEKADEKANGGKLKMYTNGNYNHWMSTVIALLSDPRRCRQVGNLLAHHLVHPAAGCGLLPIELLLSAEMCPLTRSCEYFEEVHGLFGDDSTRSEESETFLSAIAHLFQTTLLVAENIACKFTGYVRKLLMGRDPEKHQYCDTVYEGQTIISCQPLDPKAKDDGTARGFTPHKDDPTKSVKVIAGNSSQKTGTALVRFDLDGNVQDGWEPRRWPRLLEAQIDISDFAKHFAMKEDDVTSVFLMPTKTRRLRKRNTGKGTKRKARVIKKLNDSQYPKPDTIRRMQHSWKFHKQLHNVVGRIISGDGQNTAVRSKGKDPRFKHHSIQLGYHRQWYHCTVVLLEKDKENDDGTKTREVVEWWPPPDGLQPRNENAMETSMVVDGRRYFTNRKNSFDYTMLCVVCFLSPQHAGHYFVGPTFKEYGIDTSARRDKRHSIDWLGLRPNNQRDGLCCPWLIMKLQPEGTHAALYRVNEDGEALKRLDEKGNALVDHRVYLPLRATAESLLYLGEEDAMD